MPSPNLKFRLDAMAIYVVTAALSYVLIFSQPQLAFLVFSIFVSWSYFLLLIKRSFYPVVTLIIYSRTFVGFSAASGPLGYTEINIIVNYLPITLYFLSSSMPLRPKLAISTFPYTYLYGGVLFFFSAISGLDATAVLGDRLLPFFLFLMFLMRGTEERHFIEYFLSLMRFLIIGTVIVISLPGYFELATNYLESGIVFGIESETSIQLGNRPRGLGPFWDPRILGTMSALYLAALLSSRKKSSSLFDFILAFCGVTISLSRGAMVLSALLIILFLISRVTRAKLFAICMIMISVVIFGPYVVERYLLPIFSVNAVNPLEQRSGFLVAAFMKFLENPLGSGIGSMRNLSSGIDALGTQYFAVTDAYWAILLAEIGVIGVVVFCLSLREIFWSRSPVSKGLLIGLLIQMIGTDVGDFGMYYLVIMIVGRSLCGADLTVRKEVLR